jgi:hypothetical protein
VDDHPLRSVVPPRSLLGWMAEILARSSIPGSSIPSPPVPSADKLVHLAVYGLLGLLVHDTPTRPR